MCWGGEGSSQLQTNGFTLSMGGVAGGGATEGPVLLSDLLIPSVHFTRLSLAAVQSGHMGDTGGRSVPLKETKDTTCMLMHEHSGAAAGQRQQEWSVPFFW